MKRNLHADFTLCEAATPGPWFAQNNADTWQLFGGTLGVMQLIKAPKHGTNYAEYWPEEADAEFIAQAREGWPEAVRRAIEAEAEVERLHAFIEHESEVAIDVTLEIERLKAENARNVGTVFELSGALAGIIGLFDHGRLHSTKMSIGVDNAIYKAREALRNAKAEG
ncbi:hypothetical protein [Paenibacillus sp. PDC88]|uniref:hypothetical protein n=1 Tax=Paenibacillus sp. PDC88 TaxID=1884375 RepID=UPI0008996422|nr:hypothetical protein [Paenibacillus sp. PDC88]SDW24396.1 hypothetical protein SAMN05518848_101769 [Paenibacillus sp. PDC88]